MKMKTKINFAGIFLILLCLILGTASSQKKDYASESKEIILLMKDQKFDEIYSKFDSVVKKMLSREKLESTWKSFISQVGNFKQIVKDSTFTYQTFPMVQTQVKFDKMDFNFLFGFNSSGQINTFRILPVQQQYTYKNPKYAVPDTFTETAIYFGKEEWRLPGTLAMPKGDGKYPAVILVHGSGPNDRDETIGPNKPFKDLALGLASNGIAVLRYDKRTKVYGEKFMASKNYTLNEETIDDAIEAVAFLKTQKNINPDKIFVIGHSLGAYAAPRIAEKSPDVAGIILMAGPTRKFEDLIYDQINYISMLDGKIDSTEQEQLDTLKKQIERVKSKDLNLNTSNDKLVFSAPASYWLDMRAYDPVETTKKLTKPVFIMQGERDYQVNLIDYDGWKKNLEKKSNVTFKLYPKLYHLFIEGEGKSTPQEYNKEGHVADYVITDITNWVKSK